MLLQIIKILIYATCLICRWRVSSDSLEVTLKFVKIDLSHAQGSHLTISLHLLELINVVTLVRELIEHQLLLGFLIANIDLIEYPCRRTDSSLIRGQYLGI